MEVELKQLTTDTNVIGQYEHTYVLFVYHGCMGSLYATKDKINNDIVVLDINWVNCSCHLGSEIRDSSKKNSFTENERIIIEELSELLELDLVNIVFA